MMAVFLSYMLNTYQCENGYLALRMSVTKRVLIRMHRIIFNAYSFIYMLGEWNERESS